MHDAQCDIIRKTGSTERIAKPPDKDQATATVKTFDKVPPCDFRDMRADKQTDIIIVPSPDSEVIMLSFECDTQFVIYIKQQPAHSAVIDAKLTRDRQTTYAATVALTVCEPNNTKLIIKFSYKR